MDFTTARMRMAASAAKNVGQVEFTVSGTYQFIVPPNVFSLSAVLVGCGEAGMNALVNNLNYTCGGAGGYGSDLRYINDLPVNPGETLTVVVGSRADATYYSTENATKIMRGSNVLLSASAATSRFTTPVGNGPFGGVVGGGNGGRGGASGYANDSTGDPYGGGGGGAGGYSGNGGRGEDSGGNPYGPVSGGAAQGGKKHYTYSGYVDRDGGGVGIYGEGASGTVWGSGGSGGSNSPDGRYGGGGAGASAAQGRSSGKTGAARLLWGAGRSFPSNRVGNESE